MDEQHLKNRQAALRWWRLMPTQKQVKLVEQNTDWGWNMVDKSSSKIQQLWEIFGRDATIRQNALTWWNGLTDKQQLEKIQEFTGKPVSLGNWHAVRTSAENIIAIWETQK